MTHYELLGVKNTADEKELKSAFRRLAMQYHPDKNPGDASAEKKFKEINEAYETLKDPDKRAAYDYSLRGPQRTHTDFNPRTDWDDLFAKKRQYGNFGADYEFEELLRRAQARAHAPSRNKDTLLKYTVTLEEVFTGKEVELRYTTSRGQKTVKVVIPRSIRDGERVRYSGKGDDSVAGVPPGDLYVAVSVAPNDRFIRSDYTISTSVTVDFIDAMIGTYKRIPCIDGSEINLRINAGLNPGSAIKVPEKGLWKDNGERAPMMVEVVMVQPKLNNAQYELLAKLKNL